MFTNVRKLNSNLEEITRNRLDIAQEECFGFYWDSGKLVFDRPVFVSIINKSEYALVSAIEKGGFIRIYNSLGNEVTSIHPPKKNDRDLEFLYIQKNKDNGDIIGLIFTDGKTDYRYKYSLKDGIQSAPIEIGK